MTNSLKPTETTFLHKESLAQRILFCTDFSENANFAFNFAVDAAIRRPDSKLYLLHVRIDQTYRSRLPENLELKVEFRIGKDYQEILNFTRENQIDLIVMGRQGHNALQKAFFGNVTEKVVRKADSAVLVVPLSYRKRLSSS